MNCRHCRTVLTHVFLDLGFAPPSNAYLRKADMMAPEKYFPLKLYVCDNCWLVQTEDYAQADELFAPDYAYFSSTSSLWLEHAANYSDMICKKLGLNKNSFVIEIASNDGYLLKNFVAKNIPCLGIEPTRSTAQAAEALCIPVLREFFGEMLGRQLANKSPKADLVAGNNVYAHVPDINDFTKGLKAVLKQRGTITLEFPHIMNLIQQNQFDTVYHEHYSYLALYTVCRIFADYGLRVYEVEKLPTHGGSLRIYGCHAEDKRTIERNVVECLQEEKRNGLQKLSTYQGFQDRANKVKDDLVAFLIEQKRAGKKLAAYGAAAKGSTLLNYAGIKPDLLPFVCDAAGSKQGKFLPGSHIPIVHEQEIGKLKPDFVLILPWNLKSEISEQLKYIKNWKGRFVVAVPEIQLF